MVKGNSEAVVVGPDNYAYKAGYHLGAWVDISFSDHFSFQPEIMYTQRGYSGSLIGAEIHPEDRYLVTYNYVDVPLLMKFKTGFGLNFLVGPTASLLVGDHLITAVQEQ